MNRLKGVQCAVLYSDQCVCDLYTYNYLMHDFLGAPVVPGSRTASSLKSVVENYAVLQALQEKAGEIFTDSKTCTRIIEVYDDEINMVVRKLLPKTVGRELTAP